MRLSDIRVTLVVPLEAGQAPDPARLAECCAQLRSQRCEFDVLLAGMGPAPKLECDPDCTWDWVEASQPGLAPAAMSGLEAARGEVVVILDEGMGYDLADVARILAPLLDGSAELVMGSRLTPSRGGLRALAGWLARKIVATSDPLSGLIGVRKSAFDAASEQLSAVGSKFSFELIAKVPGPVLDVPVRRPHVGRRSWPSLDDVRHWKRLADHRFGNFSRLIQFCTVGASGMVVDLTAYAAFQWAFARTPLHYKEVSLFRFAWPAQLASAAVAAVLIALVWNFTLNRRLTFNDSRSGSIVRQFLAYAASNAISVPVSLFLRLQLPDWSPFFDRHRLAAAVVGIVVATTISFSMARWIVFRREPEVRDKSTDRSTQLTPDVVLHAAPAQR